MVLPATLALRAAGSRGSLALDSRRPHGGSRAMHTARAAMLRCAERLPPWCMSCGCTRCAACRSEQQVSHLVEQLIPHFDAQAVIQQGAQQTAVVHQRLQRVVLQAGGMATTAGWAEGAHCAVQHGCTESRALEQAAPVGGGGGSGSAGGEPLGLPRSHNEL